ncbi:MAG TPA: tryptophan synthase subunit alpha [Caulobacteraceae bacterium]|jgi:tryptophan synthase alpha chain|nr:tryptophan synthase subunit alpha [Caulobacteraceae bacterium]
MSIARIEKRFADLTQAGRAGFAPYIVAGDPDAETAWRMLEALPAAGADLIELGLPFSDPMADGAAVQKGAVRALAAGMTTAGVLDLARRFRDGDAMTPLVLMGYYNPILAFGLAAFAEAAAAAGVDGLIMVDLPPEESAPLQAALAAADIALIRLAAPTIDEGRLKAIAAGASGFVYLIAVTGVTGGKEADPAAAAPLVARVRAACSLPVVVGFGIRTSERAAEVARIADAAVVGSALVEEITDAIALKRDPAPKVLARVAAMAQAVREARI